MKTLRCVCGEFKALAQSDSEALGYRALFDRAVQIENNVKTAGSRPPNDLYVALGELNRRLNRSRLAYEHLKIAFQRSFEERDAETAGWACWSRGNLARASGNYYVGNSLYRYGFQLAVEAKNDRCAAYCGAGLAETMRIVGAYSASMAQHEQLRAAFLRMNDIRGLVWAIEGIGQIHNNVGQFDRAHSLFMSVIEMARGSHDLRGLAFGLKCAGETAAKLGRLEAGVALIDQSISVFETLNYRTGLAYSLRGKADALCAARLFDFALPLYKEAAQMFSAGHDERGRAYVLKGLGDYHRGVKEYSQAYDCYERALRIFKINGIGLGRRMTERALVNLGSAKSRGGLFGLKWHEKWLIS